MKRKTFLGALALAGFTACIFLANWLIANVGTVAFPGGPHTITFLGLTGPSGVLAVGLSFSLRDAAQRALGKWVILIAIVVGAALSYFVAPSLALASGAAFLLGEGFDWAVFTPLADRHLTAAVTLSNTVGSAVDTFVFLWLAGFLTQQFFVGQFVLKALMTIPALLVVIPLRVRSRRKLAVA